MPGRVFSSCSTAATGLARRNGIESARVDQIALLVPCPFTKLAPLGGTRSASSSTTRAALTVVNIWRRRSGLDRDRRTR